MKHFSLQNHSMPEAFKLIRRTAKAVFKPNVKWQSQVPSKLLQSDLESLLNCLVALYSLAYSTYTTDVILDGVGYLKVKPTLRVLDDPKSPWSIALTAAREAVQVKVDLFLDSLSEDWLEDMVRDERLYDKCLSDCVDEFRLLTEIEVFFRQIPEKNSCKALMVIRPPQTNNLMPHFVTHTGPANMRLILELVSARK